MKTVKFLSLTTLFVLPLYGLRISLGHFTTNPLEILALLSIFFWFKENPKLFFKALLKENRLFFIGIGFLFIGLFSSFLFTKPTLTGLGIIKSWFIIPLVFSFTLFDLSRQNPLFKQKISKVLYLSIALVATIALMYKFFGLTAYDGRLNAFYLSPNYLAMFLAPGVFLGLKLLQDFWIKHRATAAFFLLLASFFAILLVLYFTFSYATWLALFLSLFALQFMLSIQKFPKTFWLSSFALVVFILFFLTQLNSNKLQGFLQHNPRSSLASRQMIWLASKKILSDHPVLGIGPGNFQATYLAYQKYFPPYLEWAVPEPHNLLLAFWLQTGLLGLAGFLLILWSLLAHFHKLTVTQKNASWTFAGFLLYLFFHGIFDTPYWKNDLAFLFWLFAFLLLAQKHSAQQKNLR